VAYIEEAYEDEFGHSCTVLGDVGDLACFIVYDFSDDRFYRITLSIDRYVMENQ